MSHISHIRPTGSSPGPKGLPTVLLSDPDRTPRSATRRAASLLLGALVATSLAVSGEVGAAVAAAPTVSAPAVTAQALAPTHTVGRRWPRRPARRLVVHVVGRGETAGGLAARYHAWTRELVAVNRLGAAGTIHPGQRLRIPVVTAAVRHRHRTTGAIGTVAKSRAAKLKKRAVHTKRAHAKRRKKAQTRKRVRARLLHGPTRGWQHSRVSKATVRRLVVANARRRGVPVQLALAVAWQESGWKQHVVSDAHAFGVMQMLPSSGTWMEMYAGRPLNMRDVHDNIYAGVLMLKVLRGLVGDRGAVASYYQGLGAYQAFGVLGETKVYLRSVFAIRDSLRRGRLPA